MDYVQHTKYIQEGKKIVQFTNQRAQPQPGHLFFILSIWMLGCWQLCVRPHSACCCSAAPYIFPLKNDFFYFSLSSDTKTVKREETTIKRRKHILKTKGDFCAGFLSKSHRRKCCWCVCPSFCFKSQKSLPFQS